MTRALALELAGTPIGRLFIDGARWILDIERSYRDSVPRAILGQAFQDLNLEAPRAFAEAIPFFVNMLPEAGSLMSRWLVHHHGLAENDHLGRLAFLGRGLPGALTLTLIDHDGPVGDSRPVAARVVPNDAPIDLRMSSLAGMQPKLSVDLDADHKIVVPATGLGGRWILKAASAHYPELPRAEHAMMTFARFVGFEVPETRLLTHADLEPAVAAALADMQPEVYLCRRFDRADDGRHIHQEDLAQALSVMPAHKYSEGQKHDLAYVANKVLRILGEEGALHFLERLVFDVAIGNADAHLKNWSLLYRTPHVATLAPCYDLVPTILWLPQQRPALEWPGRPALARIDKVALVKLLQQVKLQQLKLNRPDVLARLGALAQRILETWQASGATLGLSDASFALVDKHLRSVPLIAQLAQP